jgi:ribosomal-protein-alanine N-acetyltransferase
MTEADVERVQKIAESLPRAPRWPVSAYLAAVNPENTPRRIALVAELAAESASASAPEPYSVSAPFQGCGPVTAFLVANVVPPEAELETVAVAFDAQRRGIGGLLLRTLIQMLRTNLVNTLVLEVRASNTTARNFYQENGLQEIGRRPRYYANPEEDAISMRLNLA